MHVNAGVRVHVSEDVGGGRRVRKNGGAGEDG